jgi:putative tryptophan/tyrosine transport system substrate-binding protein
VRPRGWAVGAVVIALLIAACGDGSETRRAAEPSPRTVAFLRAVSTPDTGAQAAFLDELRRAGYREGTNLTLLAKDPAEVHGDPADVERTVAGWAAQGTDLIVALSTSGAMAAARIAPSVNVLFLSNDPSAVGLVKDERRPEGRSTGATFRVPADRSLTLARRLLPDLRRVGFLFPPADPAATPHRDNVTRAGAALGIEVLAEPFAGAPDLGGAVDRAVQQQVGLLFISNTPTTVRSFPAFAAALAGRRLPVLANTATDFAVLVLEPDTRVLYRQLGRQAVRLLAGTPVRDVPVEDPSAFRLVLNRRVAADIGIALPDDLVDEADEVIS